jgi:hypothetical protein
VLKLILAIFTMKFHARLKEAPQNALRKRSSVQSNFEVLYVMINHNRIL